MTIPLSRRTAVVALLAGGLLAVPTLASAHVRVIADNATEGAFSQLTFRVPTESATASTVKLQVTLPTDRPLLYVSTKPVPGWTAAVVKATLPKPVESYGTTLTETARTVTWTADGPANGIEPGQYQEFAISAGPLSGVGDVVLPAVQTYSDGTVVAWDEPPRMNGAESEHPAPVLTVVAAAGTAPSDPAPGSAAQPDWIARGLGVGGLAAGVAGLAVALIAPRRARMVT